MNSKYLYITLFFSFLIQLLPAQDYYPLAVNNKWTYDIYDNGVFVRPSEIEITGMEEVSDSVTLFTMSTMEPGYPDREWYLVEKTEEPDVVFISVLLDTTPALLNYQHHSYTIGDTTKILLTDYEVIDHGNYTTMKGLSFDNCIRLESINRNLDLIIAPGVGLVAQWEVETPEINMLELVEFKTDMELISDIQSLSSDIEFSIFPNPTTDFLTVECQTEIANAKLQIFDVNGMLVHNEQLTSRSIIDITGFISGYYTLSVVSENKQILNRKFVVQNN